MKMIFRIAKMELQKMFYSPIAWLVLIIFAIQSGLVYTGVLENCIKAVELGYGRNTSDLTARFYIGNRGYFSGIQSNLYLYIPLITMGIMSREFTSGSIKLLYSAPISNKQIVLGKFLSMMIFGLCLTFILFTVSLHGFVGIKDFDYPMVFTGLLGLYLVICTYSAIGLFMSSLTSYQVVAAIGTFATLFVLERIGMLWQDIDFVRNITYWLSIGGRSYTFISGLICSEDILYFILVSGLFIVFTILRLKGLRENKSKYVSVIRYVGVFAVIALIGYISTVPSLMIYHDYTRTKANTLTEKSQEVISKLKGKVTIDNYVNVFGSYASYGLPQSRNYDKKLFDRYLRFYPNIKLNYKYYYAIPVQEEMAKSHNDRFKGLTVPQTLEKIAMLNGFNTNIVKPSEAYKDEIDLKSELNRFVRKISTEDGKSVSLRLFDDQLVMPFESQITVAFKRLVSEVSLPLVGFVSGHQERNVNDLGSRGYGGLAKEKTFRWSLKNNGFDFAECELSSPVNKNINILVIADAKTAFSEEELENLNNYIDRGGNLIIACDLNRQDNMNPLVERFGVTFLPGQVVEHNKGYGMDLVTSQSTKASQKLAYNFEDIVVTMDGAVAISYEPKEEYKYTSVLVSDAVENTIQLDSIGSWNELKATNFIDDKPKYSPEEGDVLGALTTALALTRKVGEKNQKIMILGDADCLSNGELVRRRIGIRAKNYALASGSFFWMSDNEVPIDVRRPTPPDDKLYVYNTDMPFLNVLYKFIIPGLFVLAFLLIWLRRKGR